MQEHRADRMLRDAILQFARVAAWQDTFRRRMLGAAAVLGALVGLLALGDALWPF